MKVKIFSARIFFVRGDLDIGTRKKIFRPYQRVLCRDNQRGRIFFRRAYDFKSADNFFRMERSNEVISFLAGNICDIRLHGGNTSLADKNSSPVANGGNNRLCATLRGERVLAVQIRRAAEHGYVANRPGNKSVDGTNFSARTSFERQNNFRRNFFRFDDVGNDFRAEKIFRDAHARTAQKIFFGTADVFFCSDYFFRTDFNRKSV